MNHPRQAQTQGDCRRCAPLVARLQMRIECLEEEKQALAEQLSLCRNQTAQAVRELYESQLEQMRRKTTAQVNELTRKLKEQKEDFAAREKALRQTICEQKSQLALYTDGGPPRNRNESLAGDTLENGAKKKHERSSREPQAPAKHSGGGRNRPSGMQEETIPRELPPDKKRCSTCGRPYAPLPPEESSKIEFRVVLRKVTQRREKYVESCNCNSGRVIHTAPLLPSAFDRCVWTDASIVEFALLKYQYQVPITRVLAMIHQSWATASDSTIYRALGKLSQILEDLESCIIHHNLQADFFQADETGIPVFVHREGYQSFYHTLWQIQGNDTIVHHLSPTRKADEIHEYFGESNRNDSTLLVDRAAVYPTLAFTLAFCWAHVRRDFIKLGRYVKGNRGFAINWLKHIRKLYKLYQKRSKSGDDDDDIKLREHVAKMEKELPSHWLTSRWGCGGALRLNHQRIKQPCGLSFEPLQSPVIGSYSSG